APAVEEAAPLSQRTVVFDPGAVARHGSQRAADEELTIPRSIAPRGASLNLDMAVNEDANTLPRSSPQVPGAHAASWNVRIAPTTMDPLCGRTIAGGKYVLESV